MESFYETQVQSRPTSRETEEKTPPGSQPPNMAAAARISATSGGDSDFAHAARH